MRTATMQAWIDALRQPERKQAHNALQLRHGQCCLGVVCEVLDARKELPKSVHWTVDKHGDGHLWANHKLISSTPSGECDGGNYVADSYLFDLLVHKLGLTIGQEHELANMNDNGSSFEQIACQLEKWFPTPRDLWVKALRSGEYTQGRSRLFDGEGHCCLGVACDVLDKAGALPEEHTWDGQVLREVNGEVSHTAMLSRAMQNALGITHTQQDELMEENDSKGTSFTGIADLLDSWSAR